MFVCISVFDFDKGVCVCSIQQKRTIQIKKHHTTNHHHHYLSYLLQGQALLVETVDLLHRYAKLTHSGVRSNGVVISIFEAFDVFVWCVSVVVLLGKN